MVSAITVIIAMSGMFITGDATFESFAVATVAVVAVEMLVALLVLPAVLAWLGDRVEKGRIPFTGRPECRAGVGLWPRWSDRVMRGRGRDHRRRHGALVALAIPALGMNIVTGSGRPAQNLAVIQTYDR